MEVKLWIYMANTQEIEKYFANCKTVKTPIEQLFEIYNLSIQIFMQESL